eukprot:jgi/Botrbrau1/20388/Bobra.0006s0049.1
MAQTEGTVHVQVLDTEWETSTKWLVQKLVGCHESVISSYQDIQFGCRSRALARGLGHKSETLLGLQVAQMHERSGGDKTLGAAPDAARAGYVRSICHI